MTLTTVHLLVRITNINGMGIHLLRQNFGPERGLPIMSETLLPRDDDMVTFRVLPSQSTRGYMPGNSRSGRRWLRSEPEI